MSGKVYILGAGASKEDTRKQKIPLPLATEFFSPQYINKYWPNIYMNKEEFVQSNLAKILKHYFTLRIISSDEYSFPEPINVEIVFSFLDNFENLYVSTTYLKDLFTNAKSELLAYIKSVIFGCPHNTQPEFMMELEKHPENSKSNSYGKLLAEQCSSFTDQYKLHTHIACCLKDEDSILSFNWDLIMDMALWVNKKLHYFETRDRILNPHLQEIHSNRNSGYFTNDELHKGYYLKMHGSVNYAICTNNNCLRSSYPIAIDETDAEFSGTLQCSYCFSPLQIFILPPHVNKTYKNNRFFKLQAGIAAQKINIASEIIIIGYSLPEFDFEANSLLRLARLFPEELDDGSENYLRKVTIVNPQTKDPKYVSKIVTALGLEYPQETHGHNVKLKLYATISDYLDN